MCVWLSTNDVLSFDRICKAGSMMPGTISFGRSILCWKFRTVNFDGTAKFIDVFCVPVASHELFKGTQSDEYAMVG